MAASLELHNPQLTITPSLGGLTAAAGSAPFVAAGGHADGFSPAQLLPVMDAVGRPAATMAAEY